MNSIPIRDIHLPDVPGWWPPAPGWWLVLAIMIVLVVGIPWLIKKLKYQPLQKIAEQEFIGIQNRYERDQDKAVLAQELSILLRRVSMSYTSRQQTAGLVGSAWTDHLDSLSGNACFTPQLNHLLSSAPYQHQPDFNAEELLSSCHSWIHTLPLDKDGATL